MSDTQWPRYEVFEQPADGAAFEHAGSVHAPDAEMALLIGRDIFGRRPERTAMWLVRDTAIFSCTREQLETRAHPSPGSSGDLEIEFHVFAKRKHKGTFIQLGRVSAGSAEAALQQALAAHPERRGWADVLAWWIFPESAVVRSDAADRRTLYDSSPGKDFRHENYYPVRTMMMELKKKRRR